MMDMEIPQEDLDIAFSEWTEKLDAGSNHWLPAYGYQQPSQLHEALMQQDYLSSDGLNQQSYAYLETIVEETSDDLRSDSEYSADGGWHDTDSETDSVIHVPNNIGICKTAMAEWGGSERDLAVPKKRRRRQYNNDPGVHDDDDDKDDFMLPPLTSRSSSLLQFETLEKQCDTVFRASASSEQFVHSPSLASSFSFDSLETSRWRFSGSPDSLNEDVASSISSSCSSSSSQLSSSQDDEDVRDDDDDLLSRSYSSRNSATDSFKSSLKSHRSFDSLIMCQEKQDSLLLSAELSQSLNNTAIICEEDSEPIAPPRCLYKTVECLTDTGFNKINNKADEEQPEKCLNENKSSSETSRGQRSAENLSEDSGFGEHIPRGNGLRRVSSSGVFTIAENDDDSSSSSYGSDNGMNNTVKIEDKNEINVEDKCKSRQDDEHWNDAVPQYSNSWQSAPDLMKLESELQSKADSSTQQTELKNSEPYLSRLDKTLISDNNALTSTTSLLTFAAIRDDDEFLIIPENKSFTNECNNKMASRHPVVSTPNLYCEEFTVGENEYELKFPDDKRTLSRAHSFKEAGRREGNLRKCKSRGSNIQITTSFINLTKTYSTSNVMITTSFVNLTTPPGVACKDDVLIEGQGSPASESKVHFSPIVSEVIWNEQDDDDDIVPKVSLDLKNKNDIHTDKKDKAINEVERGNELKARRGDRAALPPPPAPPVRHKPPTGISTTTTVSRSSTTSSLTTDDMDKTTQPNKHKSGIGGFFQRFSLRRLSSRDKKRKNLKKETLSVNKPPLKNDQVVVNNVEDLQMIIPLHGPSEERELDTGKFLLIEQQQQQQQQQEQVKHNQNERQQLDDHQQPPPPPPSTTNNREVGIIEVGSIERRLDAKEQTGAATVVNSGGSVVMSSGEGGPLPPPTRVAGLLETDLDSTDTNTTATQQQQGNKKARSLLNLGDGRTQLVPCVQQDQPVDHRAKSMEFLLDKENKFAAKPPENELQKVGERVMSEHELRVQRSLQRLHVPEWYKNSQVPVQGFLLKRHSEGGAGSNIPSTGWQGLSSKTTSLSSLGSNQAATPRSPSGPGVLSPSPTPSGHTFSRWSTSRLNSNPTSTSTSPCGSARSSFNYRQPYLGWRSQERLTNPRTPAERLAQGLLPAQKQQNVPNLSEVHSSIKEVTSAIVHYVSGSRGDDRLSPATLARHDNPSSRTGSPRGSTGRLCWLESSFVGNRPLDVPETPVSLTATPEHQGSRGSQLYLNLTSTHTPDIATVNGKSSKDAVIFTSVPNPLFL